MAKNDKAGVLEAATFMYRAGDGGEIEARLFDAGEEVPAGWYDSPASIGDKKKA